MAAPGFSVTELIQAAGHIKTVYDAFFSKYANSATQVRDLADHIEQFQNNLQIHKKAIESRGLEYSGYVAIKRTLEECERFLDKYKTVLDPRKSVVKAWKTGRFPYDKDTARLQKQIESHAMNILHFNTNILLQDALDRETISSVNNVPKALDIPGRSFDPLIPIPLPPPLLPENHRIPEESRLSLSPEDRSPNSLRMDARSWPGLDGSQGSPKSQLIMQQSPVDTVIPRQSSDAVLQRPRDYCVAKLYIGDETTELRRKAMGRNIPKARELLIFDEKGDARLKHQIRLRPRQSCYPYTWHRRWNRDFEVTFKGLPPESHLVKLYDQTAGPGVPKYNFTRPEDYEDFQSQVLGKKLLDYFDFDRIGSASSKKESTDQHLKVWKSPVSQVHSISFYASLAKKPSDLEFPISMFQQAIKSKNGMQLSLDFITADEVKGQFFKKPSRSSTVRSGSSVSSSATSTFSKRPTPAHQMTMTTVADSRMSVISTSSENSQTQADETKSGLSLLEARAKELKFISIEFSDDDEADRFRKLYDEVYNEEAARPLNFFVENWQLGANASQRPERFMSNPSPVATPFNMSPELRGQLSPILYPQR